MFSCRVTKKGASGDFFFIFAQKISPQNGQYFPVKKKKKVGIKMRPPDWPQFWPPAGQETDFFCGQPQVALNKIKKVVTCEVAG